MFSELPAAIGYPDESGMSNYYPSNWVNLTLVETRTFPDGVVLTRYETRH